MYKYYCILSSSCRKKEVKYEDNALIKFENCMAPKESPLTLWFKWVFQPNSWFLCGPFAFFMDHFPKVPLAVGVNCFFYLFSPIHHFQSFPDQRRKYTTSRAWGLIPRPIPNVSVARFPIFRKSIIDKVNQMRCGESGGRGSKNLEDFFNIFPFFLSYLLCCMVKNLSNPVRFIPLLKLTHGIISLDAFIVSQQ